MKRPMCILAVAWLAGLMLAGRDTVVGTNHILFCYFILIILGLVVLKKHPHILQSQVQEKWYPKFTLLLACIPFLFLLGHWRGEEAVLCQIQGEQPWKLLYEEGERYVTVEGVVEKKQCEETVFLELTECVIIGYYGEENQSVGDCRIRVDQEGKEWLPETFVGNKVRVFGTFSVFSPATNPGQFDAYEYYTLQNGLMADVSALRITVLDGEKAVFGHALFQCKQKLRESICHLYPQEQAGVLTAMILGDKDLLSEDVEALYRQNGISHILAISGLHISMLCMGLFGVLRKMTVPLQVSAGITVGFLVFYLFLTGASTSSLRAGTMCLIMIGAKLFRRSYDLLSSLSLAAIVVTALSPGAVTSAGFLLSFGAVLGVALAKEIETVILSEQEEERPPRWMMFLFGGMIQCVTIPVSLWFFYELSPYGILLNLVVIPLVSFILGGGILSSVLGLFWPVAAKLPVGGTYLLLEFYEWLCLQTNKLPFSFVLLGRPRVWQLVVYYTLFSMLLLWFFKRGKKKERNRGGFFFLGILSVVSVLFLPGGKTEEVLFLDVSQGDGVLITTADGTVILSDCGSSDVSKVGEYRLFSALKQKGILLVDMAVVSHMDSDHISGIRELLEKMPVYQGETRFAAEYAGTVGIKELVLPKVEKKSEAYLELEKLALTKQVALRYIQAGELLHREENFMMECLYPDRATESENDTSLVFLLQTPQLLVWLMGDAGTASEEELLAVLAHVNMQTLREEKLVVLKVGHHGSKTSSGERFLRFIRPDAAVISCGYHNSYGHPNEEVVDRILKTGATLYRTDLQGAIEIKICKGQGVQICGRLKEEKK